MKGEDRHRAAPGEEIREPPGPHLAEEHDMSADTISLEIHICDQRRSYLAHFATEDQALEFVDRKAADHAIHEVDDRPVPQTAERLLEWLYPTCEHGMDAGNCYGPQHYYYDESEQARGLLNS